jgi:hypothetical protein
VFTLSTLNIGSLVEKLSLRTEVLVGAPVELAQRRSVGGADGHRVALPR